MDVHDNVDLVPSLLLFAAERRLKSLLNTHFLIFPTGGS